MAQKGVNKAIIVGNLGGDPEIRYTPGGDAIANFNVATSEEWKDKQTGESKSKTEWHRVTAFRKIAEFMGKYMKKGAKVYVEGRLGTNKWTDKDGVEGYATSIIASTVQGLDRAPSNEQAGNFNDDTPF